MSEPNFKEYVDKIICEKTQCKNAEEQLKRKVSFRYLIFFMPIPVAVVFLLSIIFNWTIGQFFVLALLVLFIGFMISFLGTALKRGSFCEGYINKSDTPVDANDLVQFLNRNLTKAYPDYFHEWNVISIRNENAVLDAVNNAIANAHPEEFILGTKYAKSHSLIVQITQTTDRLYGNEGKMCYLFLVSPRIIGTPSYKSYSASFRVIPVLYAAMDYYLNVYRNGSETENEANVKLTKE